jgi:hypothetical protein
MSETNVPRELAVRRIAESVVATVTSGLIIWAVTSSASHRTASPETPAPEATPAVEASVVPNRTMPTGPVVSEAPLPRPDARLSIPVTAPSPLAAMPTVRKDAIPPAVMPGTVLLFEDFSHYRDGETTNWGVGTFVKMGLDRRNWLVSNVDGAHPVGCKIALPNEFSFECRYSAYLPELTRGVLGWWKEPVSSKISLVSDQGAKYSIEWTIRYGNDPLQLNPIGSSSLYVRKQYHVVKLPDGASSELGILEPTGMLRIDRDKNGIKVYVDGQPVVSGAMGPMGQLAGFEIDVVKATSGTLFFTDFKIAR